METTEQPTNQGNSIVALRETLFDTLRRLGDKENPMDIERAKAINETAQVIINTAKVEVEHLKVLGGKGSGFIPLGLPELKAPAPALQNLREKGIVAPGERQIKTGTVSSLQGRTVHTMK